MNWILRIATAILLLAALMVLVLMLAGLRYNAGRIEASVEISRPAAVVYPYLHEPDSLKKWISGLVQDSVLTDGGLRIGARSREVMSAGGERIVLESTVTGLEMNKRLDLMVTNPDFDIYERMHLDEKGGVTQLHYSAKINYHPWLARLFEPVITPDSRQEIQKDLLALKRLVEAAPAK